MIRVLLVAAARLYRDALAQAISADPALTLVGELGSADDCHAVAHDVRPDVVLLDIGMPRALRAMDRLHRSPLQCRIVALAIQTTDEELLASARVGVDGYIGDEQPLAELPAALAGAAAGLAPCPPHIASVLLRGFAEATPKPEPVLPDAGLTEREDEILALIARGMSNKQIASELVIGLATVKTHVHAILHKLDVDGRGAAAARAREHRV